MGPCVSTAPSRWKLVVAIVIPALVAAAFIAGFAAGRDGGVPSGPGLSGARTAVHVRPSAARPPLPSSREPPRVAPDLADSTEGSPSRSREPEAAPMVLHVDQRVYVHQESVKSSAVVAVLVPGVSVTVLEHRDEWSRVQWSDPDGAVSWGWILLALPSEVPRQEDRRGRGTIGGAVRFTGVAPEMKVPVKRRDAEFCKTKEVRYNAVLVRQGMLADVFVRIENGGFGRKFEPPEPRVVLAQVDCMYQPRIQGAVTGQEIIVINEDKTLHNAHVYKGGETWFGAVQLRGMDPTPRLLEEAGIVKLTCDVHPWMRAFVVVTDHPFFAVSDDNGSFTIEGVPAGTYLLEAWHARYGLKVKAGVRVVDGERAEVGFTYDAADPEPEENRDELKGLW
jgi:hypothetical protein